jgi:tetratricopeptide (TPR) repeat protein
VKAAPLRWMDRAATPAQGRAAEALGVLRAEPDLEPVALARIQSGIDVALRSTRRRTWRWQPALVVVLVLGVAGIAAATIGVVVTRKPAVVVTPLSSDPPRRPQPRRRGPVIVSAREDAPVGPPAPPVIEAPPAPAPSRSAVAPPAPPRPAERGDGPEVRLFAQATRAWRSGDARGALERLDEYQDRYPAGQFAPEAALVRIDALRALGRSKEALAFLRTLSLAQLPRSAELQVIRGELAAREGRCEEALADLDQVLRHDAGERLGARALYARASCRARLGDEVGAETDLRLYLLRFPGGPHVTDVRRALAR